MMTHILEAIVFVVYSFLSPVITAGGTMIMNNVLALFHDNLIKVTGLTSSFCVVGGIISTFVFRKDIMWKDVLVMTPVALLGAFVGSLILVNITPVILLSFMFVFSLYYIYKKIWVTEYKVVKEDTLIRKQLISFFASSVSGAALPGGGFLSAYFASRGFSLNEMFGTSAIILTFVFTIKIMVMFNSGVVQLNDFWGILIASPFLFFSNHFVRTYLKSLSKNIAYKITLFSMFLLSVYLFYSIVKTFL